MKGLKIKRLSTYSEYERCVHIQRQVWKHEDIDLVPIHHYSISVKTGAILLGAFFEGKMVAFAYSFPAVSGDKIHQHSHLVAVLPEYQGRKIGKMLKWAQRDQALKLGYDLISWTFDPLQAKNANLNLHTLGATVKDYLPNFYGPTPSLSPGKNIPTDRFLIEWQIKDKRVQTRRNKKYKSFNTDELPHALNGKLGRDEVFVPAAPWLSLTQKYILSEIPRDINQFTNKLDVVLKWQRAVRRVASHYFSKGYLGVDFIYTDRCFYVLKKNGEKST